MILAPQIIKAQFLAEKGYSLKKKLQQEAQSPQLHKQKSQRRRVSIVAEIADSLALNNNHTDQKQQSNKKRHKKAKDQSDPSSTVKNEEEQIILEINKLNRMIRHKSLLLKNQNFISQSPGRSDRQRGIIQSQYDSLNIGKRVDRSQNSPPIRKIATQGRPNKQVSRMQAILMDYQQNEFMADERRLRSPSKNSLNLLFETTITKRIYEDLTNAIAKDSHALSVESGFPELVTTTAGEDFKSRRVINIQKQLRGASELVKNSFKIKGQGSSPVLDKNVTKKSYPSQSLPRLSSFSKAKTTGAESEVDGRLNSDRKNKEQQNSLKLAPNWPELLKNKVLTRLEQNGNEQYLFVYISGLGPPVFLGFFAYKAINAKTNPQDYYYIGQSANSSTSLLAHNILALERVYISEPFRHKIQDQRMKGVFNQIRQRLGADELRWGVKKELRRRVEEWGWRIGWFKGNKFIMFLNL